MLIAHARAAHLAVKIKTLAAEAAVIRQAERRHRARHKAAEAVALALKAEAKRAEATPDAAVLGKLAARSKLHRDTWLGLAEHRRSDVRNEARAALLAHGFLRGTPYLAMERKCHLPPDWVRVAHVVQRFGLASGMPDIKAAVLAWSQSPDVVRTPPERLLAA